MKDTITSEELPEPELGVFQFVQNGMPKPTHLDDICRTKRWTGRTVRASVSRLQRWGLLRALERDRFSFVTVDASSSPT